MKKIVFIITSALLFVACNNLKDNEFLISGTANGIENGKKVFIEVQTETGTLTKDTAVVTDGKFELKGITEEIDLGFIRIENEQINLPLILEEGKIEINIVKDSLHKSTLGGTPNNDKFQKFNTESRAISEKVAKFEKDNGPEMQKAQMSNDTVTINKLLKEYKKFQNEMNDYSKKFIKENPDAYLSVLLLENFLMRQYLTPEEIKSYFEGLDKDVKETKSGKKIKTALDSMTAIVIGKPAPNFSAPSPEGKTISLKESLGKVTIIDFWASWCAPCRKKLPQLAKLYQKYKSQNVKILSISLDVDRLKWIKAIQKENMEWDNVLENNEFEGEVVKTYGVKAIPSIFLFDDKGILIAIDPSIVEMEKIIMEIISKKSE